MSKKMVIDATQPEETRVAVVNKDRLESYDFDSAARKQIKGNIFLAKVTRVEPSLQSCFVEYGGNRQGFLAFTEIHPDYYRIPIEDREALLAEEAGWDDEEDNDSDAPVNLAHVPQPDLQPDTPLSHANSEEEVPANDLQNLSIALDAVMPESLKEAVEVENDEADSNALPQPLNVTEIERDNTIESVGGTEEDVDQAQRARRFGRLRRRYKVQEVIKRRQIMLVQATKEERGQKGAAMTTYISLPGRYCVLMPNSPRGGGISKKITDPQARRKMKELLAEMDVPEGMSVIVRTAGMMRSRNEIKRDLEYLLELWDEIRRETMQSVAPAMIYEEADIFKRAIRDLYSSETLEVIISGEEGYRKVKKFMRQMVPAHAKRVQFYRDPLVPLFQRYSIEKQIADIFNPRVELRSGGYIIINPTEALVSIDVNSGRATRERHIDDTALKTNMEAAEEIARQLRLRDLGGLVVIDFIDMESGRHNTKVERRLREAMAEDRARIEIGRISGFGLLELSRQRLHPSLTETHFETCPHCNGTGIIRTVESAAVVAIRALEAEAVKGKVITLTLSVPQAVGLYILNHKRSELNRIEDYFGCHIGVRVDEKLMPSAFEIQNEKGTPVPRIKIEQLPIPHVEGQDPEITEEDMDDEPLMSLGDSRLDDDRETFDDNGDEENPRGRRNIGRNGRNGRFGGSRRGANGRGRRINTEETVPETADPYTNVVSILITEGAPIDGFDGSVAVHEDAIRNPSDTAEKSGRRRNRNRYGNRKPHTRNAQNNDVNNDANNAASGGEGSVDAQTSRTKHVEPVLVSAHDGGGDQGDKNAKRGWWQKLIE